KGAVRHEGRNDQDGNENAPNREAKDPDRNGDDHGRGQKQRKGPRAQGPPTAEEAFKQPSGWRWIAMLCGFFRRIRHSGRVSFGRALIASGSVYSRMQLGELRGLSLIE